MSTEELEDYKNELVTECNQLSVELKRLRRERQRVGEETKRLKQQRVWAQRSWDEVVSRLKNPGGVFYSLNKALIQSEFIVNAGWAKDAR